ncbi:MAG TPA: response regulator [Steroidobacteraceae bacterium]|nr:response regulator [Steroidobacteraceae bacterium]
MDPTAHVLVVDDDPEIRELLSRFLMRSGLRVSLAREWREMQRVLSAARIDLIVLDLMLPGKDGLAICRELQGTHAIPIIMLTAMGEATDRVVGLELGADDYVAKPFDPRELLARIRAVLRRRAANPSHRGAKHPLRFSGWTLDPARYRLTSPEGGLVSLSSGEFDLLLAFAEHAQRVLTREQLLDITRGRAAEPFDRSIDVQVSRLRRKIETNPQAPELIVTVRGGGYTFTPAVTPA